MQCCPRANHCYENSVHTGPLNPHLTDEETKAHLGLLTGLKVDQQLVVLELAQRYFWVCMCVCVWQAPVYFTM